MHLTMIVRNEERRIRRTLESVLPHIDSYTLLDTGSVDGTAAIAMQVLGDLPGQFIPKTWPDSFAAARNQAFEAARAFTCQTTNPFLLVLDAGEQLGTDGSTPHLTADAYQVQVNYAGCEFPSTRIFRARAPWVWKYRVHEAAYGVGSAEALPGWEVFSDVAEAGPEKYARYARLSELDLVDFPDDPRVTFYAAQNWFSAGQWRNALDRYERRVALDAGNPDEVWYSAMQMGRCWENLGDKRAAAQCYAEAAAMAPHRAEPARHLARLWADVADSIPRPKAGLFVELGAYR